MKYMEDNDATIQNLTASMKNLEVQIRQIDVEQLCPGTNDDARELEYEDMSSEEYEEPTLLDEVKNYFDISKPLELVGREIRAPKTSSEEPPNLELKQLPSHLRYVPTSEVKRATEPKHY
ncbi:hypothetical protein V6N13_104900 [Hibiscus sabdariffa]